MESTARNSFSPIAPLSQTLQQDCLGFFAVYDGHCGAECAAMASDELHNDIFSHDAFKHKGTQPPRCRIRFEALRDAFLAFDARYLERAKRESLCSGSTAVAALLCAQGRKLSSRTLVTPRRLSVVAEAPRKGAGGGGRTLSPTKRFMSRKRTNPTVRTSNRECRRREVGDGGA